MRSADDLRKAALISLATLREYRAGEQTKELVKMLDLIVEHYQSRLIDCPEAEIQSLRISAKQLLLLRTALAADDLSRVALTV